MERKIEITSKEFIKPIFPTPNHLRCLNFSIFDLIPNPATFVTTILYYPFPKELEHDKVATNSSMLLVLKKSLSHLLVRFYPFAGRINDDYTSIVCNDDGVPFIEAFAHGYYLDEIIRRPTSHIKLLQHFLPCEDTIFSPTTPMLVQVTFFECGGMSIGFYASHKITDASTLNTFINGWVAVAASNCDPKAMANLEFLHAGKFLPQRAVEVYNQLQPRSSWYNVRHEEEEVNDTVRKILFFDASCVATIKAKVVSDSVPVPTRVEALSALIWKCAMVAVNSGSSSINKKPYSLMMRPINLRKRHGLPFPSDCMGNAITSFTTIVCNEGLDDMNLPALSTLLRNSLSEFLDEYENKHDPISALTKAGIEMKNQLGRDDIEIYNFNSWCGFQISDSDFGWGKPSWISISDSPSKNCVQFMETRRNGGGIEAWVSLAKTDVEIFEQELHKVLNGCGGFEVL